MPPTTTRILLVCVAALVASSSWHATAAAQGPRLAADSDAGTTFNASAPADSPSATTRALLEIGGGILGASLAQVPTMVVIGSHHRGLQGEGDKASAVTSVVATGLEMAVFAAPITTSIGVYLAGEAAGGDGNYWAALGGSCIGGLLSLPFGYGAFGLVNSSDGEAVPLAGWMTMLSVAPVLGAMIGYELSNHGRANEADKATAANRAIVLPNVGATPDMRGATLGMTGRF